MKELKILRKMLESEEPVTDVLKLNEEEKKWFTIGFKDAKMRVGKLIDLLEEE